MKNLIFIFIALNFLLTQNYSFSSLEKSFREKKYLDFIDEIDQKIQNAKTDEDKLKLYFWKIRAEYANGEIGAADSLYQNKIINEMTGVCSGNLNLFNKEKCGDLNWEPFEKILFHEPFKKDIEKCNNTGCICSHSNLKIRFKTGEDLDFLSPKNLIKHFSTIWFVVGKKEYFSNNKFNHEFNLDQINTVDTRTSVFYGNKNLNSDILSTLKKVKFAILPQVINFDLSKDIPLIDYLNNRAKQQRFKKIRSKYWDEKEHKIDRKSLDNLDFTDIIKFKEIKSDTFEEILPKDQYGNEKEIFSKKIEYFPKIQSSPQFNYEDYFNRLYVFSGEHISRYSFKVGETASKGSKKLSSKKKKGDKQKNETFIYLKWDSWDSNKWFLRDFIEDNQFKIEIPQYYFDQYSIRINGKKYESIGKNINKFNSKGLKISTSDNRSTLPDLNNFFEDSDIEKLDGNININNLTIDEKINSDLISIETNNQETLDIVITEKEGLSKNSNIIRNIIIGFLSLLVISEAL